MTKIIDILLQMFEHEASQARVVLTAVKGIDMDYTPREGMRTLRDLANHLAQIPLLDPAMYSQEIANVEEARAREKALYHEDLKGILATLDKGIQAVKHRFTDMADKEFFANILKPFYETGSAKNWAFYMPEFITHISMHKMQLWMYLKLAGAGVDMMTYYGVVPDK